MTTDNIGGVWTYALELANGLKKSGTEVCLAVIDDPLTDNQRKELQGFRYFHFVAKQEWMEDPWDDVQKTGEWLLEIKKKINPDLVHLNSYSLVALQWDVPVVVVLHSCVLTWWKAVKKEDAPADWNRYRDKISEGIRSADTVAAPGRAMLNSAEKLYGPFKNKKLIYNGRNPQLFKKGKKEKFIFSMGRVWDEAKNIQLVSEAAAGIRYNIFVAGDYQIDEFKLKSNIFLLGRMNPDQISDWLSNAAVYVLPVFVIPKKPLVC